MAENTGHHDHENVSANAQKPAAEGVDPGAQAAEELAQGFANPLEFLNAELEKAETEKAELKDRLVRMAADMENLRRRTQRDVQDARDYSIASFAREMLAVSDNLRRALEAIPHEARDAGDAGFKALIDGVELTERSMLQALEKAGVKRIRPENERFDANFHQAMFEIQNPDVAHNTVLQVVQDGYVIGERVLRPAIVGVSRGGPKQPRPETASETQAG